MTSIFRIELPTPFPVGTVNAWLVKGDACLLIDSGMQSLESRETLERGLTKHGVSWRDLDALLITHGHVDHFGLAGEIRDRSGAAVIGHSEERPYVEAFPASHRKLITRYQEASREHGYPTGDSEFLLARHTGAENYAQASPIDRALFDGEVVEFGSVRLKALHSPGHTSGSTCYAGNGILFCGDTVLENITPITFFKAAGNRTGLRQYRNSLERLKLLEVQTAYPGHRTRISSFGGVIRKIERHLEIRTRRVLEALRSPMTAYDVSLKAFPQKVKMDRWLSFSETLGILEDLEEEGVLQREEGDPIRFRKP